MSIDRAATLLKAEKLLRQGKLDAAIVEYLRVVEGQPRDWNTANMLGDLYVRAGQIDRAVEQYMRVADSLGEEGFLPKAAALYKKILKLKPDHEHSLLQAAEIASGQGLLADARTYLNIVAEQRRKRGDGRGAAEIRIRLGTLDPSDYQARADAARARVEIGDQAGALADLKAVAAELGARKGGEGDAIEVLRQAALLDPEDDEIREQLLELHLASGDFSRARQCAVNVEQLKVIAARLDAVGREAEALDVLRDAARLDPTDLPLRARLGRAFVARGDMATAAEYLTVQTAGDDPNLLLAVAEIQIGSGRLDDGIAILKRLLENDPSRREAIAMFGWSLADHASETGFRVVELAAEASVAQADWGAAAAALQEFVTRVPNHIPALMRLVEICVDGGLEATMYSAQAHLADAYIAAGSAAEARVIAEDLVAREPWERANIERFRRALVLLGEPDPDAVIAERLSGQSPFMSTDFSVDLGDLPVPEPAIPSLEGPPAGVDAAHRAEPGAPASPAPDAVAASSGSARPDALSRRGQQKPAREESTRFELDGNADLAGILNELEPPAAAPARPAESAEVDLSVVLDDIRTSPQPLPSRRAASPPLRGDNLEAVFEELRTEVSQQSAAEDEDEQYARALAMRDAGQIGDSIAALRTASRSPRLRFSAASLLARTYREQGSVVQALEWFERAVEAPAPTPDETHSLLYELADLLEESGEVARALAVCLELQADAGAYRDVAARIKRLVKAQT